MDEQIQALDHVRDTAIDLALRFGPKVVVAILILIAGVMAGRWLGRATLRGIARLELDPPVTQLLERLVRLAVLALFAIMALQNLGVELLPLIAGIGLAGAGIALAMQGVLSNIMAGLTIIFTRPFRVGEFISIAKEEGEVLDVSLFSTTLGHADLSRVVIPNRRIVGEILHNYGRIRQLALEVGVSYDTDIKAAVSAIHEVLRSNARVLGDPAPLVITTRLYDSSVGLSIAPWVKVPDYAAATGEINEAVLEAFRRRRIDIPSPRRDVRMLPATV